MANEPLLEAANKRYDKVYDPEANKEATAEKEALRRRKEEAAKKAARTQRKR